jgi:hypothetical protein
MEQQTDYLTVTYIDLAVNVATAFRLEVSLRVFQQTTPLHVVQRVLSDSVPRRWVAARAKPDRR